jgi:hypothetical protein
MIKSFLLCFLFSLSALGSYDPSTVKAKGRVKPRMCFFAIGGAGGSLSSPTNCTSSPCTTYVDSCSSLSGTFTRLVAGDYSATSTGWKASSAVVCTVSTSGGSYAFPVMVQATDGSGNVTVRARTGSTLTDSSPIFVCFGESA